MEKGGEEVYYTYTNYKKEKADMPFYKSKEEGMSLDLEGTDKI